MDHSGGLSCKLSYCLFFPLTAIYTTSIIIFSYPLGNIFFLQLEHRTPPSPQPQAGVVAVSRSQPPAEAICFHRCRASAQPSPTWGWTSHTILMVHILKFCGQYASLSARKAILGDKLLQHTASSLLLNSQAMYTVSAVTHLFPSLS